jgi:hypothetical protein
MFGHNNVKIIHVPSVDFQEWALTINFRYEHRYPEIYRKKYWEFNAALVNFMKLLLNSKILTFLSAFCVKLQKLSVVLIS